MRPHRIRNRSPRVRHLQLYLLAIFGGFPLSHFSIADAHVEDECLRDRFQVQIVDDEVVAFGSRTSRSIVLKGDESVIGRYASGCIAVVTTNRRFLFASSRLGDLWMSVNLELNESSSLAPLMGSTVASLVTNRRFLGIDGLAGHVAAVKIQSKESVVLTGAGANIAAVATTRRLLGFSLGDSTVQELDLQLREGVEKIESSSDVVTVWTSKRVLFLGTGGGGWSERPRRLR